VFLGLILAFLVLGRIFSIDAEKIDAFLGRIPFTYSCLAFILLYVVGTFFLWHLKDPLKIVGAIVFGAYVSTFLIYVAEIINAYIFFNISSILGKDFVDRSLRGRFKSFYEKLEDLHMGWVFMLRAVPLIPYRILDLSFGLSRFPFKKYIIVVLLASPPRIFWIQFIVAAIKGISPAKMMEYFLNNKVVFVWSWIYLIFALIVAFKLKRKLK
jgi:uncharacterized membrane protein YdjX (TVP38/TMEM64 family)